MRESAIEKHRVGRTDQFLGIGAFPVLEPDEKEYFLCISRSRRTSFLSVFDGSFPNGFSGSDQAYRPPIPTGHFPSLQE